MACARGGKKHTPGFLQTATKNISAIHIAELRLFGRLWYAILLFFHSNKTGASLAIPSFFDHLGLIMAASVLSMESPPFQPRISGSGGSSAGGSSFASPGHHRNRSGASSPLSHGSMGGEAYSNAVRSYSFQTPSGYVCVCVAIYVIQRK